MTYTVLPAFIPDLLNLVKDGIAVFATEPLNYFVYMALVASGITMARKILPKKRG